MSRNILLFAIAFVSLAAISCPVADAVGQVTWRRTYGGFGTDQAVSVRQVEDGGYIIAGSTGSFGYGTSDIYVVRVDEMGAPLWSRTYGGPGLENGVSCRELADGFVVAGSVSPGPNGGYDMMLVRMDAYGAPLWERFHGTGDWDLLNAIDVISDGFVLGGLSYGMGFPMGSACIIRTDNEGQEVWRTNLGGPYRVECQGVVGTSDDGFMVVGRTGTDDRQDDGFFTKLDADGQEVWTTPVGGDSIDYLYSVVEVEGSGYVAIGGTDSESVTRRIYLVMVDLDGEVVWERFIGNEADAGGTELVQDHGASGFVFTGYNTLNFGERDMILTRTDSEGSWQAGFNYADGHTADGYSLDLTDDGGYVLAGWAEGFGPGIRAMYVVKTDQNFLTETLSVMSYTDPLPVEEVAGRFLLRLHPNPARPGDLLHVDWSSEPGTSVRLHDASGRLLFEEVLQQQAFVVPDLADGWYVLSVGDRALGGTFTPVLLQR